MIGNNNARQNPPIYHSRILLITLTNLNQNLPRLNQNLTETLTLN